MPWPTPQLVTYMLGQGIRLWRLVIHKIMNGTGKYNFLNPQHYHMGSRKKASSAI